jgi:transposase
VFWPDLVSSHYPNATLLEYERLNIKFVPKSSNPPNVPQLRPIENFWAILKRRVYKNGWATDKIENLEKKNWNLKKCRRTSARA